MFKIPMAVRQLKRRVLGQSAFSGSDAFLKNVRGIIHIGANTGQERDQYWVGGLDVIWVEPIPHIFEELTKNISSFKKQKALRYLLTAQDGETYDFNLASNGGASSSILEFSEFEDI